MKIHDVHDHEEFRAAKLREENSQRPIFYHHHLQGFFYNPALRGFVVSKDAGPFNLLRDARPRVHAHYNIVLYIAYRTLLLYYIVVLVENSRPDVIRGACTQGVRYFCALQAHISSWFTIVSSPVGDSVAKSL